VGSSRRRPNIEKRVLLLPSALLGTTKRSLKESIYDKSGHLCPLKRAPFKVSILYGFREKAEEVKLITLVPVKHKITNRKRS